jgi:hypothetical protein
MKKILNVAYVILTGITMLIVGCESITPTRVPPLTTTLGYSVPAWKGWTLTGLNEAKYNIEVKKLDTWRIMIDVVNAPALEARKQVINLWSMLATGGAMGGIPLALKAVPKGYVRKEEQPPSAQS